MGLEGGDGSGGDDAEDDADEAAGAAHDDGFDEELSEDVGGFCADGFADADLSGAFNDGDEHDVHHADAADEEGDARNAAEEHGHHGADGGAGAENFRHVADIEVIVGIGSEAMAVAEEEGDFGLQGVELGFVFGTEVDLGEVIDAEDLHHGGGVGDDDLVIGVEPSLITFGLQDANDAVVDAFDFDGFSDGVGEIVAEEILGGGGSDDGDAGGFVAVLIGEDAATLNLEFSDGKVGGRGTEETGAGIFIAAFGLNASADDGGDAGVFVQGDHGHGVGDSEVLLAAGDDAVGAALTGGDHDDIGAEGGELVVDHFLCAGGEGERGNDGPDADDDAQHRQRRAQLVGGETSHGNADDGPEHQGGYSVICGERVRAVEDYGGGGGPPRVSLLFQRVGSSVAVKSTRSPGLMPETISTTSELSRPVVTSRRSPEGRVT